MHYSVQQSLFGSSSSSFSSKSRILKSSLNRSSPSEDSDCHLGALMRVGMVTILLGGLGIRIVVVVTEFVLAETLGISCSLIEVDVWFRQLQQMLSQRMSKIKPANIQNIMAGQEYWAHAANSTPPIKMQEQQITGLTLITEPVYLGIRGIIRLIIKTPTKRD